MLLVLTECDVWGVHPARPDVKYDTLKALYLLVWGKYSLKEFCEVLRAESWCEL